jgi:hypothetical protein
LPGDGRGTFPETGRSTTVTTTYEVRSGSRSIETREASTPQQALLDYVRSLGCRDDEILRLGVDAVSWRGAVFRAVPAPHDDPR